MQTAKTFRLFISSTFVDFQDERNILQNEVFPEIKDYCRLFGYNFEPIDLRWGVSQEDSLDHKAMEICIKEVKKAFNYPKPNFLAMLGNRYGWIPAPTEIESSDFRKLLAKISNDEKEILQKWYREDLNALPHQYILQPVNSIIVEEEHYEQIWAEEEAKIVHIIVSHRDIFPKNSPVGKSATEQEIIKGILNPKKSIQNHSKALCISREIDDSDKIEQFIDRDQTRISALKKKLQYLNQKHVIYKTFHTKLKQREDGTYKPEGDYLDAFAITVKNFLKEHIEDEIKRLSRSEDIEQKVHETFKKERIQTFFGRGAIISKALAYIKNDLDLSPFVLYGESGVGKSALMAKIIQTIEDTEEQNAHLIYRFVGISEHSSQPKLLLDSLIEEIENTLHISPQNTRRDYSKSVDYFLELLHRCSSENEDRYIIVIDALDQFVTKTNLEWIESKLPKNIKIILSTLPSKYGEYFRILKTKVHPDNIHKVPKLNPEDGNDILQEWLQNHHRTLQKEQKAYLLSKFEKNGLPLYLKIIFEKSLFWRSYDTAYQTIEDTTLIGAIKSFFNDLVDIQHHPQMLLKHTLGYLSASKNGLSESEIVEILSLDYIVIGDIANPHHRLPTRSNIDKVPSAIWSRLYYDLIKYLTYIEFDGLSLLNFYHRKIKECAVETYYKTDKAYYHANLLEYFWNQPLVFTQTKEVNFRKLSELPYHCVQSNAFSKFSQLNSIEFVQTKIMHNQLDDLLLEYYHAALNLSHTNIDDTFQKAFLNKLSYNLLHALINDEKHIVTIEILHSTYVYRKDKTMYSALLDIACDLGQLKSYFRKNKNLEPFYVGFMARKANMTRREGELQEAETIYDNLIENSMIGLLDYIEQSRVYYDIGYIAYLSGEFDKAIENMTKSIEIAKKSQEKISQYISQCVKARIEFLVNNTVESFEKVLLEAYDIFYEKRLVSLTAKRWIKNLHAHLFEVYYAKRDLQKSKKIFSLTAK